MDAFLERIPYRLFREWQIFYELEPWGEERATRPLARIEAALYNIFARAQDHPGWPAERFVYRTGDMPKYEEDKHEEPQWMRNKRKLFDFARSYAAAFSTATDNLKNKVL